MKQTSKTPRYGDTIFNRAVRSLEASTGLRVSISAIEPNESRRLDGAVVIKNGNRDWKFYVEIKSHLTSHALGSAIASISEIKRQHSNTALVASYVNAPQAEKLRELNVEFFDTAGNAFFQREGLFVFVTGRKGSEGQASEVRRARAFNPTGSRLVFALLCQPGLENHPYRHLANKAGISLGAVGWIMRDLKSLGHLADHGSRGRRLLNRKDLLKRWVAAYPEQLRPKLLIGRYHTDRARDWWQNEKLPAQAFWSGEVGAQLVTHHLKPQAATIYTEINPARLQARYRLRRDVDGEIEILHKFWMFDDWEKKDSQIAPPLLIYADLVATADERNLETAAILYDQHIARLVE